MLCIKRTKLLEYLLFLPLVIFTLLFFIFTYRLENKKYKKIGIIVIFFVLFPVSFLYKDYLMEKQINFQTKKQLENYLRNFKTTFIEKPYGAQRIRLKELKTQKNKIYVFNLYKEALNDEKITYYELAYIARKISDHERLEK